jgi:hypothetical protein
MATIDFDLSHEKLFVAYSAELQKYLEFITLHKASPNIKYMQTYFLYKIVEKWQPILGFSLPTVQGHLIDIQTPMLEFNNSLSIKDILFSEDVTSSWLIPTLLQSTGMYILGGDPKTGKSILAYALAYSVTVSGEFLGLPVRTGNVLYLQLEEPLTTIKKRFRLAGFGNLENDEEASLVVNFGENRLRVERSFDLTTEIDWLIKQIQKYKPSLVIVDSLRKATAKSGHSENTNEFGKLVYGLQQVFSLTNTCGVVIHHLSKYGQDSKKKYNLVERLAGHTSISSASDGLIGLFDDSSNSEATTGSKTVSLKTRPRDGFGVGIQYSWETSSEGLWDFKRLDTNGPSKLIATSKILRFLALNCDKYVDTRTIADALNTSTTNNEFLEGIQYLVELEILRTKMQDKKRFYTLPSESTWLVNPTSIKSLVSEAVIDANNLMRCQSKASIRVLAKNWDKARKRDALVVLLEHERVRIDELITRWEFAIGDEVKLLPDLTSIYKVIEQVGLPSSLNNNRYTIQETGSDCTFEVQEDQLLLQDEVKAIEVVESEPEPEVSNIGE